VESLSSTIENLTKEKGRRRYSSFQRNTKTNSFPSSFTETLVSESRERMEDLCEQLDDFSYSCAQVCDSTDVTEEFFLIFLSSSWRSR